MENEDLLHRDVRMLGDILGEIITDLAGPESFRLVEEIRRLARLRRKGDTAAGTTLAERIAALEYSNARVVARAFSIFFDLANLAEDRHRVRVLRSRQRDRESRPRGESVAAAISRLKEAGFSAEQLQAELSRLDIELVFTAHPSEAKRRSTRARLRRLRGLLHTLDSPDLLPAERVRGLTRIRTELTVLWQTEFVRPWRPTVLQEVARGLSFVPRLWDTVPLIMDDLRQALAAHYPGAELDIPPIIRFGTWIGGDRDGNPNVTADVTAKTLSLLRETAIGMHLANCRELFGSVSISEREVHVEPSVKERIDRACRQWTVLQDKLEAISPYELYRRLLTVIEWRLERSLVAETFGELPDGAYRNVAELRADLEVMGDSLRKNHGELVATGDIQQWLDQIRVFGFHLARLDIRQDSRRYCEVMTELLAQLGISQNFDALPESERQSILTRTMPCREAIDEAKLSPLAQDSLALFRLLERGIRTYGDSILGGHVISLTHQTSDVLTVLWLWQWAAATQAEGGEPSKPTSSLRIIPLFETIDDLQRAPRIMEEMLSHPVYADYLRRQDHRQIVMVGYSDSTKDGGYLAACWWLYRVQKELHELASRYGVRLTFFHGRGGSLGRGGGPAARGILSLPPKALGGTLRLTEQGEVLAERYDDPQVAYRHLEQVTWATLLASAMPGAAVPETWPALMDRLAERSFAAYRELVDQPGFLEYFVHATPIEEIENLPIGSRPARRRGERKLSDLRAIPWVFSWTQNRCLVPAWFGLGTALEELQFESAAQWQVILDMYRDWPFFQATVDNAVLALAKVDLYVAQRYAGLVETPDVRQRIFSMIAAEYERTRRNLLAIIGGVDLLSSTPWLESSIEFRNPYVDPLNLIQVELFRRIRSTSLSDEESARLHDLLRLTVQGVAAGMRTTG